ncbi:protein of unknown function [Burkholderia multivorans]
MIAAGKVVMNTHSHDAADKKREYLTFALGGK